MRVQVKDFMTTSVIAAQGTNSIGEVREVMQREKIHAIPIVYNTDGNVIVQGIITSSDLCATINDKTPIEDALKFSKVYVLPPNTSAKSAAEMMLKHKVHHIVVMENGKLVGMISSLDFVKLVASHVLD